MIKIFKLILKKESGFSLLEVMLGGSLLVGVGLAGSQLFKDQTVAHKRINNDQALELFHNNLSKTMSLSENCNTTMNYILPNDKSVPKIGTINSLGVCVQKATGIPNPPLTRCADDNTEPDLSFDAYTDYAWEYKKAYQINDDSKMDAWQIKNMEIRDSLTHSGLVRLRVTYTTNPRVPYKKTVHKDVMLNLRLSAGKFSECVDARESSMNNLQYELCKSLAPLTIWRDEKQICEIINGSTNCGSSNQHSAGFGSNGFSICASIPSDPTAVSKLVDSSPIICSSPKKVKISFDITVKKMKLTCVN